MQMLFVSVENKSNSLTDSHFIALLPLYFFLPQKSFESIKVIRKVKATYLQ